MTHKIPRLADRQCANQAAILTRNFTFTMTGVQTATKVFSRTSFGRIVHLIALPFTISAGIRIMAVKPFPASLPAYSLTIHFITKSNITL